MDENQNLKQFLYEAKTRADSILTQDHVNAEIKKVIRDLLQIGQNYEAIKHQSQGASADSRVLKKKLDQAKSDLKVYETNLASAKNLVMKLVDEIKIVSSEAAVIFRSHGADPKSTSYISAGKLKAAAQKMAELLVQAKF